MIGLEDLSKLYYSPGYNIEYIKHWRWQRHDIQYEQVKSGKIDTEKKTVLEKVTKEGKSLSKIKNIIPHYIVLTFK